MSIEQTTGERVRVLAALADPVRLAVVDALAHGDLSPTELGRRLQVSSNLLAHHLKVLEDAGLVRRHRSESDRRRSYVGLEGPALEDLLPRPRWTAERVVFVCTRNSARSQLATALWRTCSALPAASGGTAPAAEIHPRAVSVARRHGLSLAERRPVHVGEVLRPGDLVVTVCDSAHETLSRSVPGALAALSPAGGTRVHWSIPDPAREDTDGAFERAYADVAGRVHHLADSLAVSRANAPSERGCLGVGR